MFARYAPGSGSGAYHGDLYSMMQVVIDPVGCPTGQVRVELHDGSQACVSPPSITTCPPGEQLDYDGSWTCVPCAVVIQFGAIYNGERVCAPPVQIQCWEGTVATFVVDARRWECRPPCDNGQYDRTSIDGAQICVPC